jgi:hypothetical protein
MSNQIDTDIDAEGMEPIELLDKVMAEQGLTTAPERREALKELIGIEKSPVNSRIMLEDISNNDK